MFPCFLTLGKKENCARYQKRERWAHYLRDFFGARWRRRARLHPFQPDPSPPSKSPNLSKQKVIDIPHSTRSAVHQKEGGAAVWPLPKSAHAELETVDWQARSQPVFSGKPEGPFCLYCTFIFRNERNHENWMKKSARVSEKLVSPGIPGLRYR